jgi:hypothetical protein
MKFSRGERGLGNKEIVCRKISTGEYVKREECKINQYFGFDRCWGVPDYI